LQSITSFDASAMIADFDGDLVRFQSLAGTVGAEIPHHIATIRESLENRRHSWLESTAHCTCSLLDSLLAKDSADAALMLEQAASRQSESEMHVAFGRLQDEISILLDDLHAVATAAV
jgi:hypothetical protein